MTCDSHKKRLLRSAGLFVPARPAIIRPRERNLIPGFCIPHVVAAATGLPPLVSGYDNLLWRDGMFDAANATTYTFTSLPIGDADDNRYVIAAFGWSGSSVTDASDGDAFIGGVSANLVSDGTNSAADGNGTNRCAIFIANVPTGTTATISITGLSGSPTSCHLGYWTVRMISEIAHDVQHARGSNSSRSVTIEIPDNGFAVATSRYFLGSDQSHSINQSYTEREEVFSENNQAWSDKALATSDGGVAVTSTWTGTGAEHCIVIATFNGDGS